MPELCLHLEEASIVQAENLILDQIDLSLEAGELAFLIGKTGAGKSSLLKTLYGQLPLNHGMGVVLEFDLRKLTEAQIPYLRRQIGIIFQDFNLLNDRTVYENLNWVLKATGWKKKKNRDIRIQTVLEQVSLLDKQNQMPFQISGGEQQRLVIARAILNQPKLILADEPTGNLDPETSANIMELLISLQTQTNAAILIATHDYRIFENFPARVFQCEDQQLKITSSHSLKSV